MIAALRRDRCRAARYRAVLAKGVAMFSRTSTFDATSPDGTAIADVLCKRPVAILTYSQLTRARGRRPDRLRVGHNRLPAQRVA
jgi:hypothetical protein